MENTVKNQFPEDEILNSGQFRVSDSVAIHEQKKDDKPDEDDPLDEDSDYTDDEIEYADGEGTLLDEEIDEQEEEDDAP